MTKHTLIAIVTVGMATLASAPAEAQNSATITLTGRVKAGTCTPSSPSVTLPELSAGDMTANGRVAASNTPITLQLSGCGGVTRADLTFGTAADRDTDTTTVFRNKASAAAPHTAIWLGHTSCTTASNDVTPGSTRAVTVAGATVSIPLCAAYFKKSTGSITAGDISTTFNVSITYF